MALVELRAANLALLRAVRVTPGATLTALTGETGSGKTLCITALRLALGARIEADLIRAGADTGTATSVFDEVPGAARALLEAHGIPDDDLLTLCREVSRSGRGTSRVNGALVSTATLRAIGEALIEVTAQGESQRLLRPARQRALLDAFGGEPITSSRTAVAEAVLGWREADAALAQAISAAAATAADLADAETLAAELRPLQLRPGEDAELVGECRRLRAAVALQAAMEGVRHACGGGDDALGAADTLAAARAAGGPIMGVDAAVDLVLDGCAAAVEELRDLAARARTVAAGIEVDAGRLGELEERLELLERVRRRFGGSLAAAVAALDAAERTLAAAAAGSGSIAATTAARDARRLEAGQAAARLSGLRATAAKRLERTVTEELRRLRLPKARFRVVLGRRPDPAGVIIDGEAVTCTPEGVDAVEFRFTASADGVPLPLDEGASGGELSRVALALRAVTALADDCLTLVLDEVDTGLGGETAARVGETLASIGRTRQVLVVTHRAEIAARAGHHVLLSRREGAGGAEAVATSLTEEARPAEIARLMSGRITAAATARATELLAEGGQVDAGERLPTMGRR
jgi:DNA repair protein RecN (Recombination protein N)